MIIALCMGSRVAAQSALEYAESMISSCENVDGLQFDMVKTEKVDGVLFEKNSFVKCATNPFQIYIKQDFPQRGLEVLYTDGSNGGKAIINPNGFPWVNVKLNPYGDVMRNKQHHTIFQAGFDYFINLLEHLQRKYPNEFNSMVSSRGSTTFDGHACEIVEINNPHFEYLTYRVQGSETLVDIAAKFHINDFWVMDKNASIDDYDDIRPEQLITIPNDYSPRMVLYIDKIRKIPLNIKVYDEEGLYQQYEFKNVRINPDFAANEFSKSNPAYGY